MSHELETPLLISLVILIAIIAFIVWWYGVKRLDGKKSVAFTTPGHRDDLTLIDGIGATLQKKLNDLGITSFKQIAELTEQDIDNINQQLAFKGRIEREGWVAQAQKLVEAGSRSAAGTGQAAPAADGAPAPAGGKRAGKKTTTRKKGVAGKTTKKTAKKTAKKVGKKTAKKKRTTKR